MIFWKICFYNLWFDKKCKNYNDIIWYYRSDNYDLKFWLSIKFNEVSFLINKMVMKFSICIKFIFGIVVVIGLMRCIFCYMNVFGR